MMKHAPTNKALAILFCVITLCAISTTSYACTSPTGVKGQIVYNEADQRPFVCDGTNWAAIAADPTSSPDPTLIAHWKLDDGSGTTATDSAGSNTGTLVNSPAWVSGHIGSNALEFNGTNTRVTANNTGFPSGNAERTIAFWLNSDDYGTSGTNRVINYAEGGSGQRLQITAMNNTIRLGFNGHLVDANGTPLTVSQWSHVAVVVPTGATVTNDVLLYINGALQTTSTSAGSNRTLNTDMSTQAFAIGANPVSLTAFYEGLVDDVRIYDRALTASEIIDLTCLPNTFKFDTTDSRLYYCTENYGAIAMTEPAAASTTSGTPADCTGLGDAHYNDAASGHCYYREDTSPLSYPNAKAACEADDAYLTVISSAAENTLIVDNIQGGLESFIGANDINVEGNYEWVVNESGYTLFWQGSNPGTAQNGAYTNWSGTEPSAADSFEDAVTIRPGGVWGDRYNLNDALNRRGYICEKAGTPASSCSGPDGALASMIFDDATDRLAVCNGTEWIYLNQ